MGTIDHIQANLSGETKNGNLAMHTVLKGLVHEKIITPEQYGEVVSNYILILQKPNWFLSTIQKFIGPKTDDWYYNLVKIVSSELEEEEEPKEEEDEISK
jgi:hypothetical protein